MDEKIKEIREKVLKAAPINVEGIIRLTAREFGVKGYPQTVTKEWIGDLGDLLFDLEHSHEEPVDRSDGQRSKDEVWMEIEKMFESKGFEIGG